MPVPAFCKRKLLRCRFNLHHKWVRRKNPEGQEDYLQCNACGKDIYDLERHEPEIIGGFAGGGWVSDLHLGRPARRSAVVCFAGSRADRRGDVDVKGRERCEHSVISTTVNDLLGGLDRSRRWSEGSRRSGPTYYRRPLGTMAVVYRPVPGPAVGDAMPGLSA